MSRTRTRTRTRPVSLALVAGSALAPAAALAQFDAPFEEVGSWTPGNGEIVFDLGGWNGTAIAAASIPGSDSTRTYTLDLADPAEPFVVDVDTNFGIGVGSDCTFYWDAPIDVRGGFATLIQSLGCTFDAGGQKGFSLDSQVLIRSLPGAPYYLSVSDSVADFGPLSGAAGDDFTATGFLNNLELQGFGPRDGESGSVSIDYNAEALHADGDRLYASRFDTLAYDLASLENPRFLYNWDEEVQLVDNGLGYTFGFGDPDPTIRELLVWDMTPETGPVPLGATPFEGNPRRVYAYGGAIYLATDTGIAIVDVSDPADPLVVASDHSIGDVRTMGFAPGLVYAQVDGGVRIFRVSQGACTQADLAAPFGVLDLDDLASFLAAFNASAPAADFAPPLGVYDLADIQSFVAGFNAGCP